MDVVAKNKNDEYYTPVYAILPILKYIPPNSKIWCPFDVEESYYVQLLRGAGHTVVSTHLEQGGDFFDLVSMVPPDFYIISNPPYSVKGEVLRVLFEKGSPFAMLVGVAGLFESQNRFHMFKQARPEVMYFNLRVSYLSEYSGDPKYNPPFSSVYVCSGMLPRQLVFEEVNKRLIHPEHLTV